jgi:hypothetical protein
VFVCVIIHNMVIKEDEKDANLSFEFDNIGSRVKLTRNPIRSKHFFKQTDRLKTGRHISNSVMILLTITGSFLAASLLIHSFPFPICVICDLNYDLCSGPFIYL